MILNKNYKDIRIETWIPTLLINGEEVEIRPYKNVEDSYTSSIINKKIITLEAKFTIANFVNFKKHSGDWRIKNSPYLPDTSDLFINAIIYNKTLRVNGIWSAHNLSIGKNGFVFNVQLNEFDENVYFMIASFKYQ